MTSKKTHNPDYRRGESQAVKVRNPRDTYKYLLKVGNIAVYRGMTKDLEKRKREHRSRYSNSHIEQVGRRTTRRAARRWESMGQITSSESVRIATILAIDIHREALKELERH